MRILESLPKSPITNNSKVRIVDEFLTKDIIELYQLQENINVAKYFEHGDTVHLLECMDTGYRFYYPFETIGDEDFYRKLQAEQERRGLEYDQDRVDDHRIALEQIQADDEVLEIGCNTGKFLKTVAKKTQNTLGLEFNLLAAERARQNGFNVIGESIEIHSERNIARYDIVCAFQVLEHITNISSFLNASLKALKPRGKLIFSVPNNEPFFQRFNKYEVLNLPPHHVGLWNLKAFQKLCNFYDIQLSIYKRTSPSSLLADVYLRSKLMAQVKSLPRRHSVVEKLKIAVAAPFALLRSSMDYFGNSPNRAYISVVFEKLAPANREEGNSSKQVR